MKLLDSCDAEENNTHSQLSRDEILDKVDSINKRLKGLEALKDEVEEKGAIYKTDKDSRKCIKQILSRVLPPARSARITI